MQNDLEKFTQELIEIHDLFITLTEATGHCALSELISNRLETLTHNMELFTRRLST